MKAGQVRQSVTKIGSETTWSHLLPKLFVTISWHLGKALRHHCCLASQTLGFEPHIWWNFDFAVWPIHTTKVNKGWLNASWNLERVVGWFGKGGGAVLRGYCKKLLFTNFSWHFLLPLRPLLHLPPLDKFATFQTLALTRMSSLSNVCFTNMTNWEEGALFPLAVFAWHTENFLHGARKTQFST